MNGLPRCVNPDCSDPTGGRAFPRCTKPGRINGQRFGLDGVLCLQCYARLSRRDDLKRGHKAPSRLKPRAATPKPAPTVDLEAVRTIAQLRAAAEQRRASAEPRRPCTANPLGGHRLVWPDGAHPLEPAACADCGWVFVPEQMVQRRSA